ncbi:unnamed protein product [Caenorhabditis bovis]|uniref:Apple domain-containing protein n=1 Tax=Caenorhabditis bovis TaxID=2654633 RepID=A0A8S1F9V1_9PELO|nr:unnamed protein product [Caenorhabditis bovis]
MANVKKTAAISYALCEYTESHISFLATFVLFESTNELRFESHVNILFYTVYSNPGIRVLWKCDERGHQPNTRGESAVGHIVNVQRSSKRSSERMSDNFDERYRRLNASLFESADLENTDLEFRDIAVDNPTGRHLADDDDVDEFQSTSSTFPETTTTMPFAASESLFETTINSATNVPPRSFAKSSPYFTSFTTTTTINPNGVVERFFETNELEEVGEHEDDEEEEEEEEVENDVVDISQDTKTTLGLPSATFKGVSYIELDRTVTLEPTVIRQRINDNEVSQFNGKYSVSATKYYVDNRIDGEHRVRPNLDYDESPTNLVNMLDQKLSSTNGANSLQDPFAVENEMRSVVRMHGAKTISGDPIDLDSRADPSDYEIEMRPPDDEENESQSTVRMEKKNGKEVERRETTYKGQKTVVELWNQVLHGHDLMMYPGAIFDEKLDNDRFKTSSEKAFGSKILLSNGPIRNAKLRENFLANMKTNNMAGGVRTIAKNNYIDEKSDSATADIQTICYNTKLDTGISKAQTYYESRSDISKLLCLTSCATNLSCSSVTYQQESATCSFYSTSLSQLQTIGTPGTSFHKKLSIRTTAKCVKMFITHDFLDSLEHFDSSESSSETLRLVEKNGQQQPPHTIVADNTSPLFIALSHCPSGQQVIFVRSDNVEGSKLYRFWQTSEDDCVFNCLTNTTPENTKIECAGAEFDAKRNLCYLMTSLPGDLSMTPKPIHSVNRYEKICVKKASSTQCSGGQPTRYSQMVLVGHIIDARSVPTAAECIDWCISKNNDGCLSVLFYSDETSLNCILNDSTHKRDPSAFFVENSAQVDYFSIDECLGIREVRRRVQKSRMKRRRRFLI